MSITPKKYHPAHNKEKVAATASPSPSPKATAASGIPIAPGGSGIINLDPFGAVTDPLSWRAASTAKMDVSGLFPGQSIMTGNEVFIALQKLSQRDPGRWGSVRALLVAMHSYSGTKEPNFNANWTSADEYAIKNALTQFNISNIPNPADPPAGRAPNSGMPINVTPKSFLGFAQDYANSMKTSGYSPAAVRKYTVPATADLVSIARESATKALGSPLNPAEEADFAKKFQSLILSYQKGKTDKKLQTAFSAPTNESVGLPGKTPAVGAPAGATMEAPNANVAATNFALKANPNQAASNGMNDAIGTWLANLSKGAGTNG